MTQILQKWIIVSMILIFGFGCYVIGERLTYLTTSCTPDDWVPATADRKDNIKDRIDDNLIRIYKDRIELMGNYQISQFVDSNSMLPVLDYGSNGIQIPVYPETKIYIGDIVSYRMPDWDYTVVHRVIDIREDDKGTYYVIKGDNLKEPDPYKVRRDYIKRITVGVIW